MAREYSRVKLTIWNDPDFRTRTADAQGLYFTLLTHPGITSCGVVEWRESRLIRMSADMTVERIREAAWNLGEVNLIAVDPDTEEALVRSFVRHDGVLQSPNMTLAMVREYGTIASLKLMAMVSREVRRAFTENPSWKGLKAAEPVRKQFPDAEGNPFEMVPSWFHLGSLGDGGLGGGTLPERFENGSPIPQPSSLASKEATKDIGARKRGTRIPEGFIPDEAARRWFATKHPGHSPEFVLDQTERFRNHFGAQSGQRGVKANWSLAWRNWMSEAVDRAHRTSNGYKTRQQETDDLFARAAVRMGVIPADQLAIEGATA